MSQPMSTPTTPAMKAAHEVGSWNPSTQRAMTAGLAAIQMIVETIRGGRALEPVHGGSLYTSPRR